MSEASRARRQFIINRLEELDAKLGYDRGPQPESFECDPSWGPLGSLARASMSPAEFDALVRRDAEIAALERQRTHAAPDGRIEMPEIAQPVLTDTSSPAPVWRRDPL